MLFKNSNLNDNNYINKMSQDELFMNALLDFSNLPSRRTSSFSSFKEKHQKTNQNTQRFDVEVQSQANQKLIKTFNELRNKLKDVTREFTISKQKGQAIQKQLKNQKQKSLNYMQQCQQHKLRHKNLGEQNLQLKNRLLTLKQHLKKYSDQSDQTSFLKVKLVQAHQMIQSLKFQNQKNIQISISDKISLQEQIKKIKAMKASDQEYVKQMQAQVSKTKKQYISLQTQLKKLQISYDEQVYNRKWENNTFHKQDLQNQFKKLKILYEELNNKYTKQKNRKNQLQSKLLQLEQKIGLWGVKADVYQGEVQLMQGKIKKMEKQKSNAKLLADNALNQKLTWEEKFYNCSALLEQIISRVKRQLLGDAVQLAKTCQFRLNKLKQGERQGLCRIIKQQTKKNLSASKNKSIKSRSKSMFKQSKAVNENNTEKGCFSNTMTHMQSQNNELPHFQRTILKQSNLGPVRKQLFQNSQIGQKQQPQTATTINSANHLDKQKSEINIQAKIRKQRDLMERKIRQKIMYNKIQDFPNSQKSSLREQYLNFIHI